MALSRNGNSNLGSPIETVSFTECSSVEQAKRVFLSAILHFHGEDDESITPTIGENNYIAGATYITSIGKTVFKISVTDNYWKKELKRLKGANPEYVALLKNVLRGVSRSPVSQ
jgi:hypothetical protein